MTAPPLRLQLPDPLTRADLPLLYRRTCAELLRGGPRPIELEVAHIEVDAVAIEAIGRLALAARRHGCSVTLHGADAALCELLDLAGLRDVVLSVGGGR
jgi:ABC-type transporter Mla MlaB component